MKGFVLSLCFFSAACFAPKDLLIRMGYMLNWSESLPLGLWEVTNERPTVGVYVVLCPQEIRPFLQVGGVDCTNKLLPLLKQIVGVPGDTVEVNRIGVRVNGGPYLPHSVPQDYNGNGYPMEPVIGTHRIPPGMYWLAGQHPESYDSRYFGPVDGKRFIRTLKPMVTKAYVHTSVH